MCNKSFLLSVFCILLLISCRNDSVKVSSGAKNITLVSASLDGRPTSLSYSGASITPQLTLNFSEPINHASAQNYISLNGGIVAISIAFTHHDSTLVIQPVNPLNYLTSYNLQVSPQLASTTQKIFSGSGVLIRIITGINPASKFPAISDTALVNLVQQQTLKYFYDFAEPVSGMARERNSSGNLVTTGGSGFGLMALVVGINRGFISRANGIARFVKIISYLEKADRFHGAWPHWSDGTTGKVIPFSTNDNGADLVETSFMVQGLITVRQYLTSTDTVGNNLINRINNLWQAVEFDWFRQGSQQVLYWHWSPDKGWIMNMPIRGYDEALIVYLLAAGSPTHTIPASVYQQGWAQNGSIKNGKTFYGHVLPLGQDYGGPLFFTHYSFLGFDPHTQDAYANYWTQNTNHALINHDYCTANPGNFIGYADNCWGLTASDNPWGYDAQSPTSDNGTITPTAAISSMPYTPTQSMNAIKYFYYILGDKMWGQYGFYDSFNITQGWTATSTLAIDQGPIVVMIENYRTQLLWNLFTSAPEVQAAKTKLGFN
ncbi:MAG: hypothetical protein OJF59_002263 [Cytophagales bacterium]|jgi:hypothetical protein|nr:Ig-like domain-containing protein [Bacteroidota bacterium]MBS1981555.1 Ig-like domain-containing protein [Bacteroidota bacterium]WHZ08509.1 MAG: hypothetical protein OJF59_002263 [Cytophagales bacterium]